MGRRSKLATCVAIALMAYAQSSPAADSDAWIARDKALHFDVSAGIAALTYGVSAGWIVDARWKALVLGGGFAVAAGASKELLDLAGVLGEPSWRDFAWDLIGLAVGLALAWGADLLLGGVSPARPALAAPTTAGLLVHF